jgi:N-acetylglucosaminyldiphosphoundecaprenol N-acetyl-beta-D-mannosaminyltransferase
MIKELNHKKINDGSFLIIPDGNSIVYAAKFLGTPLKERVAGPDLMEKFIEIAAYKGYKNFFLGAKEGVAKNMSEIFLKKYPKLKISGIYSPPFGDFLKRENEKIINMVNKSKSDILWVSFGCPKQEKWILDFKEKLNVPISVGIGAAFDFLSDRIKRAPKVMQKLKFEWFYRFLQEPLRLWDRYFIGGFRFIRIILKQKYFDKID